MHRLTWSLGAQAMSLIFPDGAHALPDPIVVSFQAQSVLLVAAHAFLVRDRTVQPLVEGKELLLQGARLCWQREPAVRPSFMSAERTRNDEVRHDGARLTVFDAEGKEHPVEQRPLIVGRHPACDIATIDQRVSLFHCALLRAGAAIRVIDLGSRNGTYVDGARVSQAIMTRQAALRVGRRRFELRTESGGDDDAPAPAASPRMRVLEAQVARIAPTTATLMIQGESGAGKELVARQLHQASGRTGAFVAINAAVLSSTLASSELFGHVRGAFTGADTDRVGAFAAADGGTLFLDEVAELGPGVQAELLRAVELRAVRRVGEAIERHVDVRLVVATHRRLDDMVRAGTFREDLYHRLSVIVLHVPPLRERPEDLTQITERFLRTQTPPRTLTDGAWNKLRGHPWPGNVRELLNTLRRSVLMSDALELSTQDLALTPRATPAGSLDHLIHDTVIATYEANDGSTAKTARDLGLQRRTVHRLVRSSLRKMDGSRDARARATRR